MKKLSSRGGFPGGSMVKNPLQEIQVCFLGQEDHSSILVWDIPWTEEPDRLQSMGS